jgi:hypothetical protein
MHSTRLHTVHRRIFIIVLASSSVKPTGGLAAPLAPRHCNQRMKLHFVFLVCFCSSPANDTGAKELALPYAELLNIPQAHPSVPRSRPSWTLNVDQSLCVASRFLAAPLAPRLCNQHTKLHLGGVGFRFTTPAS